MDISKTIVSYDRLNRALSRTQQSLPTRGGFESMDADTEQAEFIAKLNAGLVKLQQSQVRPDVLAVTDDQIVSLVQSYTAEESAKIEKVAPLPRVGGFEATFDEDDWLGWARQFFTWWRGIVKHRWLEAEPAAESIPDRCRVAVLGDWGTGMYGAPVCAKSIAADPERFNLLMHLGDVYYSGTDKEVKERFLAVWPKVAGAISRSLNSNHEMYTGGHAYFQQTLREFNQKASYFALQNRHWTLVGLDTAYDDHDLKEPQAQWLRSIVQASKDRKVVLFSHHQPFSLIDGPGPKLVAKLAEFLDTKRIFAWYWGHEHRGVIYDRHEAWGLLGRCIGHSGYPYYRKSVIDFPPDPQHPGWRKISARNMAPGGHVVDGPNPYVVGHEDEYGPNGYLTLNFDNEHLTEAVCNATGTVILQQQLC